MNYFNEMVVLLKQESKTREEALEILSNKLLEKKIVKSDFFKHVLQREKNFPTGLVMGDVGIAIPHTDSEYVCHSQIAFMSLKEPIVFYEMGSVDKEVKVQLIFMLALKEAHEQLTMLQKLIETLQRKEVLEQLLKVETSDEFVRIISDNQLG